MRTRRIMALAVVLCLMFGLVGPISAYPSEGYASDPAQEETLSPGATVGVVILGALEIWGIVWLINRWMHADDRRRAAYVKAHPALDERTRKAILSGNILIGMTDDEVIAARGRPGDINSTIGTHGVEQQWVYGSGASAMYAYFDNGILTTIQR